MFLFLRPLRRSCSHFIIHYIAIASYIHIITHQFFSYITSLHPTLKLRKPIYHTGGKIRNCLSLLLLISISNTAGELYMHVHNVLLIYRTPDGSEIIVSFYRFCPKGQLPASRLFACSIYQVQLCTFYSGAPPVICSRGLEGRHEGHVGTCWRTNVSKRSTTIRNAFFIDRHIGRVRLNYV